MLDPHLIEMLLGRGAVERVHMHERVMDEDDIQRLRNAAASVLEYTSSLTEDVLESYFVFTQIVAMMEQELGLRGVQLIPPERRRQQCDRTERKKRSNKNDIS